DGAWRSVDCGAHPSVAALSADGRRLAAGTWQGALVVVDLDRGTRRELRAHSGTTFGLAFVPADPDLLVSSGGADGVTFWDLEHDLACRNLLREDAPVRSITLGADGRTLAASTVSGGVLLDLG